MRDRGRGGGALLLAPLRVMVVHELAAVTLASLASLATLASLSRLGRGAGQPVAEVISGFKQADVVAGITRLLGVCFFSFGVFD